LGLQSLRAAVEKTAEGKFLTGKPLDWKNIKDFLNGPGSLNQNLVFGVKKAV